MRHTTTRSVLLTFGGLIVAFAAAATPAGAQGSAGAQAGVAAAVRGEVRQVSLTPSTVPAGAAVGRVVASGDRIFLGDKIATGPQAGLQIMLLDETIFTIGPNAEMVIDKFVYDPSTNGGEVTASIVKGAFRFVSGRIAKSNPADMNLRVGVATMGIRGTAAAGMVNPGTPGGDPDTVNVVLLGPGPENNADEREGRITLGNGGNSVEISRPGFGSNIVGESGTPSPPERLSLEQLNAIIGGLGGGNNDGANDADGGAGGSSGNGGGNGDSDSNGDGGSGDGSSGDGGNGQTAGGSSGGAIGGGPTGGGSIGGGINQLSGQTIGAGLNNVNTLTQITGTSGAANQQQESGAENTAEDAAQNAGSVLASIATFEDLRSIETGLAGYLMQDVALTGAHGSGQYDAAFLIDFSARTLNVAVGNVAYGWDNDDRNIRTFTYADGVSYGAQAGPTTTVHASNDETAGDRFTLSFNNRGIEDCVACAQGTQHNYNNDIVRVAYEIRNNTTSGTIADAAHIDVTVTNGNNGDQIGGAATAPAIVPNGNLPLIVESDN